MDIEPVLGRAFRLPLGDPDWQSVLLTQLCGGGEALDGSRCHIAQYEPPFNIIMPRGPSRR